MESTPYFVRKLCHPQQRIATRNKRFSTCIAPSMSSPTPSHSVLAWFAYVMEFARIWHVCNFLRVGRRLFFMFINLLLHCAVPAACPSMWQVFLHMRRITICGCCLTCPQACVEVKLKLSCLPLPISLSLSLSLSQSQSPSHSSFISAAFVRFTWWKLCALPTFDYCFGSCSFCFCHTEIYVCTVHSYTHKYRIQYTHTHALSLTKTQAGINIFVYIAYATDSR